MKSHSTIYSNLAYDSIREYLEHRNTFSIESSPIPDELSYVAACFVSIHCKDGRLRGCIGSIEPHTSCIYLEIIRNAIGAAFHDLRFSPVTSNELDSLNISVSVLSKPVKIESIDELDPHKYGIIIIDELGNKGVLLPSIPGIDTVEKQIEIARKKAGISEHEVVNTMIYKFSTVLFH